jgi:cell division protease FtsH
MVVAMAGRAAELLRNGVASSGAAADLESANALARQAVERFGFSSRIGSLVTEATGSPLPLAEETRARIDAEVARLVTDAEHEAMRVLWDHYGVLVRLAGALVDHEEVHRHELDRIFQLAA